MKRSLRKKIRTIKHTFSADQLQAFSEDVCSRLSKEPKLINAKTILAYYPLPDEVNIAGFLDTLISKGKRVVLPEVVSDSEMILREYQGSFNLHSGSFGILEPNGEIFNDFFQIDIALIPGMAFDANGNRLGRGKGYYDRFFARILSEVGTLPYLIGICFPFQKVEVVPTDEHDYPMDTII